MGTNSSNQRPLLLHSERLVRTCANKCINKAGMPAKQEMTDLHSLTQTYTSTYDTDL